MENRELHTTLDNGKYRYDLRLFPYGNGWRVQYAEVDNDPNMSTLLDSEDNEYPNYGIAYQHYWRIFSHMSRLYQIETDEPVEWNKTAS